MTDTLRYPHVKITVTNNLEWTILCKEIIDPYNGQSRFAGRLSVGETQTFEVTNTLTPCGGTVKWRKEMMEKYPIRYQFRYYDSPYGVNIDMTESNNEKKYELRANPAYVDKRYPDILCVEIV